VEGFGGIGDDLTSRTAFHAALFGVGCSQSHDEINNAGRAAALLLAGAAAEFQAAHLARVDMAGEGQQRVPSCRILKPLRAADALVRACGRDGVAGSIPLVVLLMAYDKLNLAILLWNARYLTRMHLKTATNLSPHASATAITRS
jgi:hypothetical protein